MRNAAKQTIVRLVPDANGGIGRLFSYMEKGEGDQAAYRIETISTHGAFAKSAALLPVRLARFAAHCRSTRPGLVHINLASRGSTYRKMMYAAICRRYAIPYLIHLHGGGYRTFYEGASARLKAHIASMFRGASMVVTTGEVWRAFVVETLKLPADRVAVLANGVPGPSRLDLALREAPPRLLFLGLLHPDKGVPELIEALASHKMRGLQWTATLAGGGDVAGCRADIAARGLADRVSVPGWLGAADVKNLLERSSILVLPSHVENQPLSLLEGMAYGLCPIATPVGAIGEVIENGVNGLLVPPGHASTLEAALCHVIADPRLRASLGANARRTFEARFDLDRMQRGLEKLYARAMRNAPAPKASIAREQSASAA